MKIVNNTIEVKPYSISELAHIYSVSAHTMRKWLQRHSKTIGQKIGHLYTVLQVKAIFEALGIPGIVNEE